MAPLVPPVPASLVTRNGLGSFRTHLIFGFPSRLILSSWFYTGPYFGPLILAVLGGVVVLDKLSLIRSQLKYLMDLKIVAFLLFIGQNTVPYVNYFTLQTNHTQKSLHNGNES